MQSPAMDATSMPNPELIDPYASPVIAPQPPVSSYDYDYVPDHDTLLLDTLEASVEASIETPAEADGIRAPSPAVGQNGASLKKGKKLKKTRMPRYTSFETQPPPMPELDPWEHYVRQMIPLALYRGPRLGRRTGARIGSSVSEGHGNGTGTREGKGRKSKGKDLELKYWCIKAGDLVSVPNDECEGCEEDCIYTEAESEGYNGRDGEE